MKSTLRYLLYIGLSLLLAFFIRVFLCNFYWVPTDSMAPTIQPGDFMLAEKWTYGARIFTSLKFDNESDPPMKRVLGFGRIQRNDVVLFNFPYRSDWDTIRMDVDNVMVKRCIGLPGDSLSIIDSYYHVSGLSDTLGYIPGQRQLAGHRGALDSTLMRTYPFDTIQFQWDIRNFGPLYIPAAGTTIVLTPQNLALYNKQIVYETNAVIRQEDALVYINDTLRHDYTFRSNWYFIAGDKVMNSQDSRYTGLIPEAYIIGKASFLLTSKDRYSGEIRWNRMFKRIK